MSSHRTLLVETHFFSFLSYGKLALYSQLTMEEEGRRRPAAGGRLAQYAGLLARSRIKLTLQSAANREDARRKTQDCWPGHGQTNYLFFHTDIHLHYIYTYTYTYIHINCVICLIRNICNITYR
jgi:hypothetical protein